MYKLGFYFILFKFLFSQDLVFNPHKKSGYLFEKLKYKKRKHVITQTTNTKQLANEQSIEEGKIKEELIEYLKKAVVSKEKKHIVEKLKETVDVRRNCLNDQKEIFNSSFQLYLACPQLVNNNNSL